MCMDSEEGVGTDDCRNWRGGDWTEGRLESEGGGVSMETEYRTE